MEYIARDVDTVVWLDCDVMLTGDPRSEVAALVSEMRQSGEIIAACNESFDLGTFCRNWETKGKNTVPFVRLLHQLGVASHHPYLNSGVFVAASRGWLAKWKELTFDIQEHFLFEQNAFNAAAWLAPEHVRLLDRRHWNLHGSDLDRISIGTDLASLRCDGQHVMVVHATSENERHVGLLEGSGRLGDRRIPVWLKIFRQPSLQAQQRAHLDQFIGSHEGELAEHL